MSKFPRYFFDLLGRRRTTYSELFRTEVERLTANESQAEEIRKLLEDFLLETDFIPALSHINIPSKVGFLSELLNRIKERFLPRIYRDRDFVGLIFSLSKEHRDFVNEFDFSDQHFNRFLALIAPKREAAVRRVQQQILSAIEIICVRMAATATDSSIRERLQSRPELESCFIEVQRAASNFVIKRDEESFEKLQSDNQRCIQASRHVRDQRESLGISLSLTYRLFSIQHSAERVSVLLSLARAIPENINPSGVSNLLGRVIADEAQLSELTSLIAQSFGLLLYQVSEHNSEAGGKYIGGSTRDFVWILKAGALGGVIVGALSFLKPLSSGLLLAPLHEAFIYGSIYSAIFLAIYFLGAVLATKQPAMTAARIAAAVESAEHSRRAVFVLSQLSINVFRIQIAATVANALLAFPIAFGVAWVLSLGFGEILPAYKASDLATSLHVWKSGTIFYAFLTGLCLAVSGLFGGIMTNWVVFEQIEKRIRLAYPTQNWIHKFAPWLKKHIGGIASNVSLGFILGSLAEVGYIVGLPFDVRHITFASAQLGTSIGVLGNHLDAWTLAWILAGIVSVGAINLLVSFSFTLWVVLRSRAIEKDVLSKLLKVLCYRLVKEPLVFILPVGSRIQKKVVYKSPISRA